jgi:concanavalin A-like lectin/glucanase superfamily protein
MKKEILIFATVFASVAFVSCSKEKIAQEPTAKINTEGTLANIPSAQVPVLDSLLINLEGRFEFDGNLKDKMGKLPDGISTSRAGAKYITDRKDNTNKALKLDGYYGINLSNVPEQTHVSISVWLNIPENPTANFSRGIVEGKDIFIDDSYLHEQNGYFHEISGIVITGYDSVQNIPKGAVIYWPYFSSWHHFVITYDGSILKFYCDGLLYQQKDWTGTIPSARNKYKVGFTDQEPGLLFGYWVGAVDDLRFYSRTLSANDVHRLYIQ